MSDARQDVMKMQQELESDARATVEKELPPHISEFVRPALDRMLRRKDGLEKPIPLPWKKLNEEIGGGLWPGMYVLTGTTGAGKSQFCMQMATQAARNGTPVLYIALELGDVDMVARLLGSFLAEEQAARPRGKGSWSGLYLGTDKVGLGDAVDVAEQIESLPIHLDLLSPMKWNHETLEGKAKAMRHRYPEKKDRAGNPERGSRPFMIVLDFLQLVGGDSELRERIGKAAYAARDVARTLDATVVLLSSTARGNYGEMNQEIDTKKTPPSAFVGKGKESGDVEYAADAVFVLCAEPWKDNEPPVGGTRINLAIAKQRTGTTSWIEMRFDGTHFSEGYEREAIELNTGGGLAAFKAKALKGSEAEHA